MAEPSLLRDALVYLGAAVVCVPLAKRAGLGSVMGYRRVRRGVDVVSDRP
jgi:Kef-type K+ transport system membrane component KefB